MQQSDLIQTFGPSCRSVPPDSQIVVSVLKQPAKKNNDSTHHANHQDQSHHFLRGISLAPCDNQPLKTITSQNVVTHPTSIGFMFIIFLKDFASRAPAAMGRGRSAGRPPKGGPPANGPPGNFGDDDPQLHVQGMNAELRRQFARVFTFLDQVDAVSQLACVLGLRNENSIDEALANIIPKAIGTVERNVTNSKKELDIQISQLQDQLSKQVEDLQQKTQQTHSQMQQDLRNMVELKQELQDLQKLAKQHQLEMEQNMKKQTADLKEELQELQRIAKLNQVALENSIQKQTVDLKQEMGALAGWMLRTYIPPFLGPVGPLPGGPGGFPPPPSGGGSQHDADGGNRQPPPPIGGHPPAGGGGNRPDRPPPPPGAGGNRPSDDGGDRPPPPAGGGGNRPSDGAPGNGGNRRDDGGNSPPPPGGGASGPHSGGTGGKGEGKDGGGKDGRAVAAGPPGRGAHSVGKGGTHHENQVTDAEIEAILGPELPDQQGGKGRKDGPKGHKAAPAGGERCSCTCCHGQRSSQGGNA